MDSSRSAPGPEPQPLYEAIYDLVRRIPLGQVATYGQIAELLGLPGRARVVGYALFRVPLDSDIPWQRVVNAKGMISTSPLRQGGDDLQRILLQQEGIPFDTQGRLSLAQYRWQPSPAEIPTFPKRGPDISL